MEHAGFLLALGLNGHLKNLALYTSFNYLDKLHEMTSVGILLGKLDQSVYKLRNRGNLGKIRKLAYQSEIHIFLLFP